MTITEMERRRLIGESGGTASPYPRFQRSGVIASLMGMLAGLGMLVVLTAVLAAGAILLNLEFDFIDTAAEVREISVVGIVIAALVVLVSTFVGGFTAGRAARYGGIRLGLGSSLWLLIVFLLFAGLTLLLGVISDTFGGFDLADRLSLLDRPDLVVAATITAVGLIVLALLGGLVGGRVGETKDQDLRDMEAVIDLRPIEKDAEGAEPGGIEAESQEQPTRVHRAETVSPGRVLTNQQTYPRHGPDAGRGDTVSPQDKEHSP